MFERSISFNNLWKLLIDRKLSQAGLRKALGIAHSTMTKMRRDEVVSLELLRKICTYLDCDIGDILSFIKTEIEVAEESSAPVEPVAQKPKSKKRVSRK
jgi:DNA-binding Xre family transcriptional regulator